MSDQAYRAYGKGGSCTRPTPRAAALAYFEQAPRSRKCDVTTGRSEEGFFTQRYSVGAPPRRWKDVTAKQAPTLPDMANAADLGGSSG